VTSPAPAFDVPFNRPDVPPFDAIADDIRDALASGSLTKGPQLAAFEREAAALIGTSHVVGVSSCTTGLMLVLKALDQLATGCSSPAGRRPVCPTHAGRREVIVPSFIFLAAPAAIAWAGMRPVFVEVHPRSYTLDPAAVERAITPATAAILACHTFGCPCDMERLAKIAARAGISLVIDAAHGLGTEVCGRQVGSGGLAQVFSLSPTKLVVAGEGGLVATDCPCLAAAIEEAREYGNDGAYGCERAGVNGRLPEISAALGRASLARLSATMQMPCSTCRAWSSRRSPRRPRAAGRISASASTPPRPGFPATPSAGPSPRRGSTPGPTIRPLATGWRPSPRRPPPAPRSRSPIILPIRSWPCRWGRMSRPPWPGGWPMRCGRSSPAAGR